MDKPVELIPLLCIRCSTPLPAGVDEAAWVCAQCGQGLYLDESAGLAALDVHYAPGINPAKPGRPFWVCEGQVNLRRETYSGNEDIEAQQFWGQRRRFMIPAFTCPQGTLLELGSQMLANPPDLQEGPAAPFLPVTFNARDTKPLAEFIVMAVEAARRDMLKEVQFSLQLSEPVLWVLP